MYSLRYETIPFNISVYVAHVFNAGSTHINYLINWNDFFKLYIPPKHRIQTIHSIEERVRNPLICAHSDQKATPLEWIFL